jgi:hypothetical protein
MSNYIYQHTFSKAHLILETTKPPTREKRFEAMSLLGESIFTYPYFFEAWELLAWLIDSEDEVYIILNLISLIDSGLNTDGSCLRCFAICPLKIRLS